VWQETERALGESRPEVFFEVLRDCGALARVLPEVDRLFGVPQRADYHPEVDTGVHLMLVLDTAARLNAPLTVRFACLGHDLGKGTTRAEDLPRHIAHEARSVKLVQAVCERLRVPSDCRELAVVVAREHGNVHRSESLDATAVMRLLDRCDAWRRPQRFSEMLLACECDARGRTGFEGRPYPQRERLQRALDAALAVDTASVSSEALARGWQGSAIGDAIRQARQAVVVMALASPVE
jgi:tRNA nucleotidyltransferase (CCA-adding enzyme)